MYPLGHILKVADLVKIKLFFMERFYYNLNYNKILHKNLDKALLFSRSQVFVWKSEKFKYTVVQYFCWNLAHISYFWIMDFFIFFRSWVICKN